MQLTILIFILTLLTSCSQEKKSNLEKKPQAKALVDTIIIKHENVLKATYEFEFYSKSYSYYSLVGKDTLDLFVSAEEHEGDSTLHLSIHHSQPLLFVSVLDNLIKCTSLIKKDFDFTKLSSISFKSPIYYFDLARELSKEYLGKFGNKRISYQKGNEFLLASSLNKQLDQFLNPLDKKVKRYNIEKFRLMDKKDFNSYLPGVDLSDYPEFTIDGYTGINVLVETK